MDGVANAIGNRYAIGRVLGRGATATVYLAQDRVAGRSVALKVLRPDLTESAAAERFLREIKLMSALHHPHILPVLDAGHIGETLYFALPLMEGGSLRRRLAAEKQLPIAEAVRITRTIADALGYAHERHLIHRDVKPENILFTGGEACLSDFGIARAIEHALDLSESSTSTGIVRGTLAYMSPEQAAGNSTYDGRSDLFSLGCVLYEMLAGVPAYSAATPEALLAQRLLHRPRDLRVYRSAVSDQLTNAVMKLLEIVPADRYANAAELSKHLGELADAGALALPPTRETPVALSASAARPVPRPRPRRWWVAATVAGAATIAATAVALSLRPPPRAAPERIAVLYMEAAAGDTSLRRVADGLTEELIYQLSGVPAFSIISRDGVRAFRGRAVPFDTLANVLRVGTVVEGTVSRLGDSVRVRARLVDPRTRAYVDSLVVDHPARAMVGASTELAERVAAQLRVHLGQTVRMHQVLAGTDSREARDLMLRAQRYRDDANVLAGHANPADLEAARVAFVRADTLFARAHEADPRWTQALVERAWAMDESRQLLSAAEQQATLALALRLAGEAVAMERSPEALELRGTLEWTRVLASTSDRPDTTAIRPAEDDLRAALDRDSTLAGAWATLSHILWIKGSHAEASLAALRALREDAFLTRVRTVFSNLFFDALMLGRYADAGEWCRRGRLSSPDDWRFVDCELTLMRHNPAALPDTQRAWQLVRTLEQLDPPDRARAAGRAYHPIYRRIVAATISARAGNTTLARSELDRARRSAQRDSSLLLDLAYDEAYLRLQLRDTSRAVRLLRNLTRARPLLIPMLSRDPLFAGVPVVAKAR